MIKTISIVSLAIVAFGFLVNPALAQINQTLTNQTLTNQTLTNQTLTNQTLTNANATASLSREALINQCESKMGSKLSPELKNDLNAASLEDLRKTCG